MPTTLTIDDEATTLTELWLHDLVEKTNRWWQQTGTDRLSLIHVAHLGLHLCRWGETKGLCAMPVGVSPRVIAVTLGPLFMGDRKGLQDEARKWVMDTAGWRRMGFGEGPANAGGGK